MSTTIIPHPVHVTGGSIIPPVTIGPNLAKALAQAQQNCKPAPLDKKNDHRGTWYASAESVIQTGKEAMAGTGLAFSAIGQQLINFSYSDEKRIDGNGEILCHFLLTHESGESLPCQCVWAVLTHKGMSLRDALASASTGSMSCMLRGVLQMPKAAGKPKTVAPAAPAVGNVTGLRAPAATTEHPPASADQISRLKNQVEELKRLGMKPETISNALLAYGSPDFDHLLASQAVELTGKFADRIATLAAKGPKVGFPPQPAGASNGTK